MAELERGRRGDVRSSPHDGRLEQRGGPKKQPQSQPQREECDRRRSVYRRRVIGLIIIILRPLFWLHRAGLGRRRVGGIQELEELNGQILLNDRCRV